jgi:putative cell wall-binding protein
LKHRTHRLRRLLAAAALGVGAMGGSLVALSGVAGAATTTKATISATTKTLATWVGTNQPAGTIVITLTAAGTLSGKTITLTATNTPATGSVVFSTAKATSSGVLITKGATYPTGVKGVGTATITIKVTTKATGNKGKITVHTVRYTTNAAAHKAKKVKVTPAATGITFNPTHVFNATYPAVGPTTPDFVNLSALTIRPVPPIGEGAVSHLVSGWALTIGGTATEGIVAGAHVKITIAPHTFTKVTNGCAQTNAVAFATTPKVSVTATGTKHTTVAPTKIKVSSGSLSGNNGCTGFFAPNVFTVDFTSNVKFNHNTGKLTILITTVKYSVATNTAVGTVNVSDTFYRSATGLVATYHTETTTGVTSTNAVVSHAYVTVKTVKTVAPKSFDATIGTISVVESIASTVPKGYVCLSLHDSTRAVAKGWRNTTTYTGTVNSPFTFNSASKPTVKVSGGNATASTAALTTVTPRYVLSFKVTAASKTNKPSSFTVSGLAVNDNATNPTAAPLVTAWYSTTATCGPRIANGIGATTPTDNVAVAFTTSRKHVQQIYGQTAAATAVAELETVFSARGTTTTCPKATFGTTSFLGRTERPVVLATDKTYPDALASQYLAGRLGTGTLLSTVTSLPSVTANALRAEGISHVYVVGGPLAVSTTVLNAIATMPVYKCGGNGLQRNLDGQTSFIQITRIWGQTAYDTAQQIAQFVPANRVGAENAAAAYAGGPTGHGAYNNTTGSASAKPSSSGPLKTAILAAGTEFQDAEAASALAYHTGLPVLLTTPTALSSQAATAIVNLHVQQVLVMGGPLAVTNTVVSTLEAMTVTGRKVSVLRIGGKDYTDTAVQLAKFEVGEDETTMGPGWDPTTLAVTRGNGFTDGIAGAVLEHGTFTGLPILLTENPTTVGTYLANFLKLAGVGYATETGFPERATSLIILGGPLAVTPTIIAQMQTDLAH